MVPSAAQKPQSPPPPPPKPATQPAASGQAQQTQPQGQGQAQGTPASTKPATQTGYSTQDGFGTQPRTTVARAQPQGDGFETAKAKPVTLDPTASAPTTTTTPTTPTTTPAPATQATGTEAAGAKPTGTEAAGGQAGGIGAAGTQATGAADPSKAPDPKDPTAGMSEQETQAYNNLPPDQRQRYDQLHEEAATNTQAGPPPVTPESSVAALRKLLTSGQVDELIKVEDALGGQSGPQAKTDLHQMLFKGQLPGQVNPVDSQTTLQTLARLADDGTKLLPNINRQDLLGSLLHDLNHPEDIRQLQNSVNCSGGIAAYDMAMNAPAEYAREVSELAQHGKVDLDSRVVEMLRGMGIAVGEPQTRTFTGEFDPNQNATAQLFGGGFTEAAQEEDDGQGGGWLGGIFHKITDAVQRALGVDEGVTGRQLVEELNSDASGAKWGSYNLPPAGDQNVSQDVKNEARETTDSMLATASRNHPVMVNVDGHWVAVTKYDQKTGKVLEYFDPNAKRGQPKPPMTLDDIMTKASAVVYQPSNTQGVDVPADLTTHPEWDDEGGGSPSTTGAGSGSGN